MQCRPIGQCCKSTAAARDSLATLRISRVEASPYSMICFRCCRFEILGIAGLFSASHNLRRKGLGPCNLTIYGPKP